MSPGIEAGEGGRRDLVLDGATLHLTWGAPRVVAIADKPQPWGYFQFPSIARMDSGALLVKWSMQPDSIKSYGQKKAGWMKSTDDGRTWTPAEDEATDRPFAFALSNGERISIHTPTPLKASELTLPPPVGQAVENYSKVTRSFYRQDQLPDALRGVYLKRFPANGAAPVIEQDPLDDPGLLRYELQGLLPVVWWGDLRRDRDGSIVAGVYPGFYADDKGIVDWQMGISFNRSTDAGHSWKAIGRIPYRVDPATDGQMAVRSGFTEPAFEILSDGSYLCVLRTTDGAGVGPMYVSRSRDRGTTWSEPVVLAPNGVLPKLLRLENNAIILAAGRPGVQVRLAYAEANQWSDPIDLVPWKTEKDQVSCGYTGLLALGPDRFLIVYSDFLHPVAGGEMRKAILVREFNVIRQ